MPSPRLRGYLVPTAIQNAPLDALRSHRLPIYDDPAVAAAQRNPPPRTFMPSKMAMRWNTKGPDQGYYEPETLPLEYVQLQSTPSVALAQRLTAPRSPMEPLRELALAFQDELWTQIHDVEPLNGPSLGRQIPYPGRLPAASFEELDEIEHWATTRQQIERREARMNAMRELRESDDMIAEIMGKFR